MARDSVAEVRDQTDIVDLVEQYVQLKRAGSSYKGLCPFHQEKSPSFVVFPQSGTFNCFGCGKRGDALTFYQEVERVDFREALHELARRANITLSTTPVKDPAEQDRRQRLVAANDAAARLFQRAIGIDQGRAGRELAERRGIDAAMMRAFRIGYSPDSWDSLLNNLDAQGLPADVALEAGLVIRNEAGRTYDRFRGRLMFPIADRDGDIVGFGGRALGDDQPKYLNSPQTPLFDKSGLLYGLHLAKDAIRERGESVVVEGYMDVVTAHQFGHHNVVAAMGHGPDRSASQSRQAIRPPDHPRPGRRRGWTGSHGPRDRDNDRRWRPARVRRSASHRVDWTDQRPAAIEDRDPRRDDAGWQRPR